LRWPIGNVDDTAVVDIPKTRYAWNGDVALAYQVVGDGPADLLYLQGWASNVDRAWESPFLARFLERLSSGVRLIVTDRRGWGCSDRFAPSFVPPFETHTDDVIAVMDAVGSKRTALFATMDCAPIAMLFAAGHPERVSALILGDPVVSYAPTEDTPWVNTPEITESWLQAVKEQYPEPDWWVGPEDHPEKLWFERFVRSCAAPGSVVAEFHRYLDTDIRAILPSILVPTLVFVAPEGRGERDPRNGRFVAGRIPGARLAEIPTTPGSLNWSHWYGRAHGILREVAGFLSEIREDEARFDRVLATVLFTDIVGSTERAASLGDRAWRELLERHHATVRALLARYHGTEVSTAGDGFFATFDGPARAIRCARAIVDAVQALGLQIRAGVHTGEVETIDGEVGGLGVVIGARVGALAGASEVLASRTVKDLTAGSGLVFEDAGEHDLKGVPDRWQLYRVVG